ncbi:uncharacterized protein LOC124910546 [Impatiens glandulifera]|uniref:uncharacterized protein LOC124910546 n=1 Tax=Impatiens glandulifera TaxID=253017 RepID=UPI001FB0F829|nr:uncharacterized protein LOC124910546 [Impatiens glandulifera]
MSSASEDGTGKEFLHDVVNSTPKLDNSRIATVDVNERKMQNFNFSFLHQFPLFNFFFRNQDASKQETVTVEQIPKEESKPKPNPAFVKFPTTLPSVLSLKLEGEESEKEESSNPVVLWQVYVIGGVLVGKWLISRWQERRAKDNPSSEDDDPPQE